MKLNPDLYKKYNVPGPRYTSYPTVPYWEDIPTEEVWISSLRKNLSENSEKGIGAAIYIHIPFCQSLCTYCGCNTRITRNKSVGLPYVKTVLKEWEHYLEKLPKPILLSEIHLGGGTPTFLSPSEIETLMQGILSSVSLTEGAGFSVEADPRVTTNEHLAKLHELGFRRLSLGIQDFDPKVQEIVHRVQSFEQVREVTLRAREIGFQSINYDLIYGLPFQTQESVRKTIEQVRELRPDRIAFYGYAHVPWIKPGQRRFTESDLPAGDEKRALYELGRGLLEEVGYREIGMDHFTLETDRLWSAFQNRELHRNFMGYTSKQVSPLIGLGVSAIGDSWNVFSQNEKLLEKYESRVQSGEIPVFRGHILTEEDEVLRRHILNLMTSFHTTWENESVSTPYLDSVSKKLEEFSKDGLLELRGPSCHVKTEGRPFLRNICMAFDARLSAKAPTTQLFSKAI